MDRQTQLENARRAIFSSYSEDHSAPTASSSSPCIPTKSSKLTGADEEALTTSNPSGTNKRAFNRRASKKQRSRSLVRHTNPAEGSSSANSPRKAASSSLLWRCTVFLTTLLIPNCILKRCLGTKDLRVCQSWREKFTLCWIIFILCCALAFMTFGLSTLVCDNSNNYRTLSFFKKANQEGKEKWFLIHGKIFSPFSPQSSGLSAMAKAKVEDFVGHDVSDLFTRAPACEEIGIPYPFVCRVPGVPSLRECIEPGLLNGIHVVGNVALEWKDVDNSRSRFVYNGKVYDLAKYLSEFPSPSDPNKPFSDHVDRILRTSIGRDATKAMSALPHTTKACLGDLFLVGNLDVKSMGCIMTDIILWISLLIILSVIFIRFMLAGFYSWFISRRLGRLHLRDGEEIRFKRSRTPSSFSTKYSKAKDRTANSLGAPETMVSNHLMNVILLVTCYSEGEASIRTTIDSLASTDYPDEHKLLFIIADGMIKGAGNEKTTPEIILDMIEFANVEDISPLPQYSLALSEGSKRLNMAKVYSGRYRTLDGVHWVPALVVVKCGTPLEEAAGTDKKPGNRGKRDSQIILMSWLSKSLFNDRMTPLEYEIHRKVRNCFSLDPAAFEAVLMVDADTFVLPASLSKMIAVLEDDPMIMGMCGETQISNKGASWVTAIQVFEYYISHHLSKAFESVFGGVTCLPGCFCMYRIKAKREDGWVPLLANPDIIDQYSENVTDTLHKKNLLLLGEDRYLTTLMLKTFPCRKLIFLAAAKCRTFVPDRFSILLSQRRRWINSTVHNLCELVLVRDLCGTLCCSMQFVVFMELVGSLVLPAAIIFTVVLIVTAFLGDPQWIPLFLLLAILGLPAVLILFTTRELGYILWMFIYLISLPIWNFVLPVYAFWHFDDFSWGETRRLDAESGKSTNAAGGHGAAEGDFDWKMITMKRWQEYDEELWE